MKKIRIFLVMSAALALGACASTNGFKITDVSNFQGGEVLRASAEQQPDLRVETVEIDGDKKVVNLSTDPYSTLGLFKTRAIAENRFTAVEGIVSDVRFGEYFPGSIGGKCWAVAGDKEYFCQSVLYRLGEDASFRAAYVMDAVPEEAAKTKVMALSLNGDYAYDLSGKEFPVDKKMYSDGKILREFVEKNGTSAISVPIVLDLNKIIAGWNEYSMPEGILLSPLGSEEVKYIASINPQYTFADKLVGTGNFTLKPDPIGMIAGLAMDILRAGQAPTTGWDYNSQLPSRRNMGLIIEYVSKLKYLMFQSILAENAKLRTALANKGTEPVAVASPTEAKVEPKAKAENKKSKKSAVPEKTAKAVAPQKTVSMEVKALQEDIQKLGYPEKVALALAEKINGKRFVPVEVLNGTITKSLIKKGEVIEPARLRWNFGQDEYFPAEKYQEGEHTLYRVYTTFQTLFRL